MSNLTYTTSTFAENPVCPACGLPNDKHEFFGFGRSSYDDYFCGGAPEWRPCLNTDPHNPISFLDEGPTRVVYMEDGNLIIRTKKRGSKSAIFKVCASNKNQAGPGYIWIAISLTPDNPADVAFMESIST